MQRERKQLFRNKILIAFISSLMLCSVQAAQPLWTFEPSTPVKLSVAKGEIAQVIYTVHNQSSHPKNLLIKSIAGISQSAPCQLPVNGSCTLKLSINGSELQGDVVGGPELCQGGSHAQCYQPSPDNILRIRLLAELVPLTQNLTLSVNSPFPGSDPALTGKARIIRIENRSTVAASNVQVNHSAFPAGTAITSNTCTGTLNAGAACDITITPGATASPDNLANACTSSPGTEPVPSTVTVSSDNAQSTNINVLILGYGCIYRGGFLFSVDDTTVNTSSIGGKVAARTDEVVMGNFDFQWATTSVITGATSITDGLSNTNALASPVGQYPAAQLCLNKISVEGFSDWYMPAICELGRYGGNGIDSGCGAINPNLYSTLYLKNLGNFAANDYWSSSQYSPSPSGTAWLQNFLNDLHSRDLKTLSLQVRCVRTFIS